MSKRHRERDEQAVSWMLLAPASPFVPPDRQRNAVPGTIIRMANCGHWVLLSPQGRHQFEHGNCYTMCVPCDIASVESLFLGTSKSEAYAVPGGLEAATHDMPSHEVDQVRAWVRDRGIKEL